MAFDYRKEYERYKKYYLSIEPLLKKKQNRVYTAVIFSFLAISLFGWYAIRPTMQTIFKLQREITDRTKINKQMEDKITSLIEAQSAYQNIESSLPILAQAFPKDPEPIKALEQVRALADESRVLIDSINVPRVPLIAQTEEKTKGASTSNDFIISMTVTGGYQEVKQFLVGIRNIRRIMQIDSLSFSPQSDTKASSTPSAAPESASTLVSVDIKIKIFYLGV